MITVGGEVLASFTNMGGYIQPQAHVQVRSDMHCPFPAQFLVLNGYVVVAQLVSNMIDYGMGPQVLQHCPTRRFGSAIARAHHSLEIGRAHV